MATLEDLLDAHPALNVSWVARALGISRHTLHSRLRRGGPELTPDEKERLAQALREKGLRFESDLSDDED
jgi:transposase-like protein